MNDRTDFAFAMGLTRDNSSEPKWVDGNGKVYESVFDVPPIALAAVVRAELRARLGMHPWDTMPFKQESFEALDALMAIATEAKRKI